MVISELIRFEVESRSLRMVEEHVAAKKARAGQVSPMALARYLSSLELLLARSVENLSTAARVARSRGEHALAEHFERKFEEERGHDRWAASDLATLERGGWIVVEDVRPLPAVHELVQFVEDLASSEPKLFLVYVLSIEYFTVLAGPPWIEALTRCSGVPVEALTVVARHVEADQEHAATGLASVDEHLGSGDLEVAVRETVARSFLLFHKLFEEVAHA